MPDPVQIQSGIVRRKKFTQYVLLRRVRLARRLVRHIRRNFCAFTNVNFVARRPVCHRFASEGEKHADS
jgi:hypothetical protein